MFANYLLKDGLNMKTFVAFILILSSTITSVYSQRIIQIGYDQDAQGNCQFYCLNNAFCSYILKLSFSSLENAKSDHALPYRAAVKPGRTNLFKLLKEKCQKFDAVQVYDCL